MAAEENDAIGQLKKAIRNAESQHAYYRKRYNAIGAPPSVAPYLKLASIYRKQKDYGAEVKILERFVRLITTEDGQVHVHQQSTKNMLSQLERARQLNKQKSDGTCEGCGKSPRQLAQIESGQWVCAACLREIRGPQRSKEYATPEQITRLREHGISVPDDLPRTEYRRLTVMIMLRDRGIPFDSSATLEELETRERTTYVNHRSVNVAGVSHNNRDGTSRQKIIARCSAGEVLRLRSEEDNPADPNAVAVIRLNGEQLGYLHREDAAEVRHKSEQGWVYAAIISKILGDNHSGHCLGVGLSLVYALATADPAIVKRHLADLAQKFRNAR